MEYHLQLELWRGNVAGAIHLARQRNQLSDWIVSMAPLASYDLWELVSAEYADQLEEDGQYHKAATYLLAGHKVHQAVDLFRRHRLFREAVSLAKVRLSPVDPILEDLYTEWGQSLMKDGQFEQAAKCYLAMRQIQEAGKMLTRRHDQSSLKTACHMTLLANEKQQGLAYAFKLFTQHLIMGEWKEAENFAGEHDSLKVFLPLLHTHHLLVDQLSSLCPGLTLTQKPVVSGDLSSQEDGRSGAKLGPLEFLLDKSETDPVVPWPCHLIGEHTFPHHVLHTWCTHLDVGQLMKEVKATHDAVAQVAVTQQGLGDVPSLVLQVSIELTQCMLSLLASETSTAIQHVLHTLSSLHQANHKALLQAICRLMLPQGPRYFLKLQQELNASRVLITMESHGDLDKAGGEGHSTIKKYLTDIKEDLALSTATSRCRELDCVRAFYYLAVLDYLRDSFPGGSALSDDEGSHDGMPNGVVRLASSSESSVALTSELSSSSQGVEAETVSSPKAPGEVGGSAGKTSQEQREGKGAAVLKSSDGPLGGGSSGDGVKGRGEASGLDSGPVTESGSLAETNNSKQNSPVRSGGGALSVNHSESNSSVSSENADCDTKSGDASSIGRDPGPHTDKSPTAQGVGGRNRNSSSSSSSVDPPSVPTSQKPGVRSPTPRSPSTMKLPPSPSAFPSPPTSAKGKKGGTANASPPSQPSPGHHSQGELTQKNLLRLSKGVLWDVQAKREALTETLGYVHRAISQHLLTHRPRSDAKDTSSSSNQNCSSISSPKDMDGGPQEDGSCHRSRQQQQLSPPFQLSNGARPPPLPSNGQQLSPLHQMSTSSAVFSRSLSENLPSPVSSRVQKSRSVSECTSSDLSSGLLGKVDPSLALSIQVERELLGPMAEAVSPKSRKVLWLDGKCSSTENLSPNSVSQLSRKAPDGTTIPLEWDELAVDVKYSQPYVTLAMLRQEQENITQELKRVPDASKTPFPGASQSVRRLLDTCMAAPHLSLQEKKAFVTQLSDWAGLFAVTSQQKLETEKLFAIEQFIDH